MRMYCDLISRALESGLKVELFIVKDGPYEGDLGVDIGGVRFPWFPWETFEEPIGCQNDKGQDEKENLLADVVENLIEFNKRHDVDDRDPVGAFHLGHYSCSRSNDYAIIHRKEKHKCTENEVYEM